MSIDYDDHEAVCTTLHKQLEGLLHCSDLSGLLACDQCHGPHGLMDTAVLPQAIRGRKDGGDIQRHRY